MGKIVIDLREIRKSYPAGDTQIEVLHGINLTVREGEMLAIMGASGSGKSTLMNIIGTLDKMTSGSYFFEGRDIKDFEDRQLATLRNRRLGFVFQSFNLLPRLSVAQNIARPLMYARVPQAERHRLVSDMLSRVNLKTKINAWPAQLSGGQQQRVAIARALVLSPALILADEPTGALDSATSKMIMTEMVRINREEKRTIVLITHDEKVAAYASRIIRIQDGQIV